MYAGVYENRSTLRTLKYYPYASFYLLLFSNFPLCLQTYYSTKVSKELVYDENVVWGTSLVLNVQALNQFGPWFPYLLIKEWVEVNMKLKMSLPNVTVFNTSWTLP